MFRGKSFPLLPGFSFDRKIGCERWHKSSQLDWINGKVPYLVEPKRPSTAAGYPFPWDPVDQKYPSLYPQKEHGELPAWIIYDKQILCFDAYFYDTSFEQQGSPDQIRRVKINYFLEDGTLQVNERKVNNSGISQGTFISRRRIPFPKPMEKAFYDMIDFNIGKSVELFGRKYHIFDCDKFTRQWLNRSGIAVPDAVDTPIDQAELRRKAVKPAPKVVPKRRDKLGQFLKFDGHVLRFYGYWDDRESEAGDMHKLILQYYLSDDTIDVREKGGDLVLARAPLPKAPDGPPAPGASDPVNLLNVLNGRVARDSKNVGALNVEYYTDGDLLPGVCVNVYGRAVVLTGCDPFTQDFYRAKYGIDHFGNQSAPPMEVGKKKAAEARRKGNDQQQRSLPPWNGFGSFEDSAGNCVALEPKAIRGNSVKKLVKARSGLDSSILRFRAHLVSKDSLDQTRQFVVAYYLTDDTTSIFEVAARNSGFEQRMFVGRKEAFKPVESLLVSRKPCTYSKEDFWVGNVLDIDKYKFELLEADEYCLKYMELNSQEFPKSNIELILMKIRERLRPVYKTFVRDHLLPDGQQTISHQSLGTALQLLLGSDVTPHEVITVARHFALNERRDPFDKETLRDICRNECRRLLFSGNDRLSENLRQTNHTGTGFIARARAYSMCRGAKVPVAPDLLNTVLDHVDKNSAGEVSISDLLSFFDTMQNTTITFVPFNHAREFSPLTKQNAPPISASVVDCVRLIDRLALEEDLKKES